MDYSDHIDYMLDAAVKGGEIAMDYFRMQTLQIGSKGRGDVVTEADHKAQDMIEKILMDAFPDYGFLAEEQDFHSQEIPDSKRRFVVDPIDGTKNYASGRKDFAVAIALQEFENEKWNTIASVVDMPAHANTMWAEKGRGAYLILPEGEQVKLQTKESDINPSMLGQMNPKDALDGKVIELGLVKSTSALQPEMISELWGSGCGVRMTGCAALMLSWVAGMGNDAFISGGLHEWDLAPGILIATEAGAEHSVKTVKLGENERDVHVTSQNAVVHRALENILDKVIERGESLGRG